MTRRDRARKAAQRRAHALRMDTRTAGPRPSRARGGREDALKVLLRQKRVVPVKGRRGLFRTVYTRGDLAV